MSLVFLSDNSLTTMLLFILPRSRLRSVEVSSDVIPSILRLVPDCLLEELFLPSSLTEDIESGSELVLSNPGGGDRDSRLEADFGSVCSTT